MDKKVCTVIMLSVWMGISTVLTVFYCINYSESVHSFPRQLLERTDENDFAKSQQPDLDNYREALIKTLNSPHHKNSRTNLYHVILLSNLLPRITNISRIHTPGNEVFLKYIAPSGLPVIFTDMLVNTALEKWSWDLIKKRWGGHVFHNTRQGGYFKRINRLGKHYVNRVSIRLSDFIDIVTGVKEPTEHEKDLYITKQKLLPQHALDEEFYYPPFYPGKHKECYLEPTGWIGAPGTYTQGHIDSKDNFVYQLIGQKKWTIYPPTDYKYLYYTKNKGSLEWSHVLTSPNKPDLSVYPLYVNTHPIEFVMNPGEVLYLPRGWSHFVENLTPSLMLNTWRKGPAAITESWIEKNKQEIRKLCY